MKKFLFLFLLIVLVNAVNAQIIPYKNKNLSARVRAQDLLNRMNIDEKIAQLQCYYNKSFYVDSNGSFNSTKADKYFKYGIGQIARINEAIPGKTINQHPKEAAELYNQVQKYFIEHTRLGIPVMIHEEGLHGQQSQDATSFPIPIALASTWDEDLLTEIFSNVAEEIRARGGHEVLAPVVDVVRDPRWGRTEETLGEDPFLISKLAIAEIKGFQGTNNDYLPSNKVAATLKHFGVHGQSEGGINVSPSNIDERTAHEIFFKPFKNCIEIAKPLCIMPCYNELFGIPVHANKSLLTDLVRKKWGFNGIYVSDYYAVANLNNLHFTAENMATAGIQAFNAGVDIETPEAEGFTHLKSALSQNKITINEINEHVLRVLEVKFKLGLFDNPFIDASKAEQIVGNEEKRKLAYKAASEGMVLLKNQNSFLPLDSNKVKTIAFIGPNADKCILGGYSDKPRQLVSPLKAIKELYSDKFEILYSEGVKITDKNDWFADVIKLADSSENKSKIIEAIEVAKKADVVVLFVGTNESTNREGWSDGHLGDLPTLELQSNQLELINEIIKLGKPTCAFVNSGPPQNLSILQDHIPAIMQCWYLGQESGYAMVDALFGKINPSGKLPISFPRSVGHIPAYYNYKPSARRGYNLGYQVSPLYPFGYGLSYTSFSYQNLKLSKSKIKPTESCSVSVNIKNTGYVEGTEIVQLYIRDKVASITRPVKELKGFKRVKLRPGEQQTVNFVIDKEMLSFYNKDMKWVAEPGDFDIMVGTSSHQTNNILLTLLP